MVTLLKVVNCELAKVNRHGNLINIANEIARDLHADSYASEGDTLGVTCCKHYNDSEPNDVRPTSLAVYCRTSPLPCNYE